MTGQDNSAIVTRSVDAPEGFSGPYMTVHTPQQVIRIPILYDVTVVYNADHELVSVETVDQGGDFSHCHVSLRNMDKAWRP